MPVPVCPTDLGSFGKSDLIYEFSHNETSIGFIVTTFSGQVPGKSEAGLRTIENPIRRKRKSFSPTEEIRNQGKLMIYEEERLFMAFGAGGCFRAEPFRT